MSSADTALLSRGLNFAPINRPNPFLLFKDLNCYIRNLTLQRHYNIQKTKDSLTPTQQVNITSSHPSPEDVDNTSDIYDYDCSEITHTTDDYPCTENDLFRLLTQHLATSPPIIHSDLKPKSIFFPTRSKGPYIESFYRVVFSDMTKLCNTTSTSISHNLSSSETRSLQQFISAEDLIIKPADKGGGIILQNKIDYIAEAERLLSDHTTYTKLSKDPTNDFTSEAEVLIMTALKDNIISKVESLFFRKSFYSIPYFYHLPKIHKNQHNPPGRPIVASMDSITSGFSLYVDRYLQPLVHQLQSYIRDGTHLMEQLLPYRWEPTYSWLSLDVSSLYTSIPHDFGIMALEYFLSKNPLINPR